MKHFNPFDYVNDREFNLNETEQIGLENYINNLLGPNFWSQVMGNKSVGFNSKVFQTNDEIIVLVSIPGLLCESDLKLILKGLKLFLQIHVAEKSAGIHGEPGDVKKRAINQIITLPALVKKAGIKAVYKDNLLEIKFAKEEKIEEQEIHVKFI